MEQLSDYYLALSTHMECGKKSYRWHIYDEAVFFSWAQGYNPALSTIHRVALHNLCDNITSLRATDGIFLLPSPQ